MTQNNKIDILNGKLLPSILRFAIPIIITGILQQLFHLADTAIVGIFTDSNALAAVGTNGEIVALLVTVSSGLSVGANVRIAGLIGGQRTEKIPAVIHTSLLLALFLGILTSITSFFLTHDILQLIQVPKEILSSASTYLQIYLIGLPFLLLYDFASAILRAFGDSKRPLIAMVISGIINVILNLILVIVVKMGVSGVAISTAVSNLISCVLVTYWVMKIGYLERIGFHSTEALAILKIGIPAAVQGAVFCFANIFVQSAVNSLGTTTVAGASIAMNFEYLTYYSITAFGQTATTFISQNFAAGNNNRCKKTTAFCMVSSFLFCLMMTLPIVLFRYQAAGIFSNDDHAIKAAAIRIIVILTLEPICAVYECLAGTIRGLGHSLAPAIITTAGTCLFRISWILFVFPHWHSEKILYLSFPLSWIITSCAMMIAYHIFQAKKESDNACSALSPC